MLQLAFFLDVDNTLLANDEVKESLNEHLRVELGSELNARFWEIYEQVRTEQSVVNIPLALQRLRAETSMETLDELTYQHVHSLFDNFPFFQYLYPYVLETLHYLSSLGQTIIVSDGDQYFQAEKIVESSLAEAVEGRVLIFIHKQQHLSEILRDYPAEHYAMIDDKVQILADSKLLLTNRLTTVFVHQGKYSREPFPENFTPEISVEKIGDLRYCTREQFFQIEKA